MGFGNSFVHHLRVRYQETDQMGVVYHANYLNWFEICRTEWIRDLGMSYTEIEAKGLRLPVTEVQAKYLQPAFYDDLIEVRLRLTDSSHIRVNFEYEVRRQHDGELLITGSTRHVWVNRQWKPVRLDRELPELNKLIIRHLAD